MRRVQHLEMGCHAPALLFPTAEQKQQETLCSRPLPPPPYACRPPHAPVLLPVCSLTSATEVGRDGRPVSDSPPQAEKTLWFSVLSGRGHSTRSKTSC